MRLKKRKSAPNNAGAAKNRTSYEVRFLISCFALVVGIVVEVALDVDDGRALVAAAARQVAQRADQVGQAAGCRALGHHVADENKSSK